MRRSGLTAVTAVLAFATVLVSCSSAKKTPTTATTASASSAPTAAPTSAAPLTASFRGVTATSIKVGIVTIDYTCIKQFVDYNFGPQQQIDQTMLTDLNNHGGILGRKIVPDFKSYCPITNTQALAQCTQLTEDDQVFAVLGVVYDASGDAPLCYARDHQTVHIGHELSGRWIAEAPPGLLLTPDTTHDRSAAILLSLAKRQGTLTGKKVATLADQTSDPTITQTVKPALDAMGVAQGSPAVLNITGADTSAAQAQLDSFIQKWKSEGVNAIFMAGDNPPSKQFVDKIKAVMPDVLLMSDSDAAVQGGAQDATQAHQNPNPYDGFLVANQFSDSEQWQYPGITKCVQQYEADSGQTIIGPDQLQPGPDGKRAESWMAVRDFCGELALFTAIATRAGPNLTNATWTQAANSIGKLTLPETPYNSIHTGKYDANDAARLAVFDPTLGAKGDFKPLTAMMDAAS